MWQDEFKREADVRVYESAPRPKERKHPGATERLKNLIWARDHCDGLLCVIIAKAKDESADPRQGADWSPRPKDELMRITELNEETGAFRAESVKKFPARKPAAEVRPSVDAVRPANLALRREDKNNRRQARQ